MAEGSTRGTQGAGAGSDSADGGGSRSRGARQRHRVAAMSGGVKRRRGRGQHSGSGVRPLVSSSSAAWGKYGQYTYPVARGHAAECRTSRCRLRRTDSESSLDLRRVPPRGRGRGQQEGSGAARAVDLVIFCSMMPKTRRRSKVTPCQPCRLFLDPFFERCLAVLNVDKGR